MCLKVIGLTVTDRQVQQTYILCNGVKKLHCSRLFDTTGEVRGDPWPLAGQDCGRINPGQVSDACIRERERERDSLSYPINDFFSTPFFS